MSTGGLAQPDVSPCTSLIFLWLLMFVNGSAIIPARNEVGGDEEAGEGEDHHGRRGHEHVDGELVDAALKLHLGDHT